MRGHVGQIAIPPAPTGLNATGGDGSITWEWNAVDGAMGYQVQVSMTEDFSGADTVDLDADTTSYSVDVDAGMTRYLRVRATGMGDPSDWATHVTGMSNPPEPAPEPTPDPIDVSFSLSEDADNSLHYLIANEDDDDAATATAKVNTEIIVTSNTSAVITPMFVPGAAGVDVDAADNNTPFTFVSWNLLQSKVLTDGATFKIQRTTKGANQMMEPTGDVMYLTCGPFNCGEGMDAPVPSIEDSPVCTAWKPDVRFEVGKVDNDVLGLESPGELESNDGIDLGIVTDSPGIKMTLNHKFDNVAGGINTSKKVEAASGSNKTLAMSAIGSFITVNAEADDTTTANIDESVVCDNMYTTEDVSLKEDRPGGSNCFRLIGPGAGRSDNDASKGANYLAGWTIELSPLGADVSWGSIELEEDPFEELTCGNANTVTVSDQVNVCDMFEAEVSGGTGKGWKPEVVFNASNQVVMWRAGTSPSTGHEKMFKSIWFDDNLNGKILKDTAARRPDPDADGAGTAAGAQATIHDLYDQNDNDNNINKIWEFLTDSDGDLVASAGDLGKVDLLSSTDDRSTVDDERTIAVESCPSGTSYAPRDGYASDNTTRDSTQLDDTPCKTSAQRGTLDGSARTASATAVATHPDGQADNYETAGTRTDVEHSTTAENADKNRTVVTGADDFYKCSEDDGGNDEGPDGDSSCDAKWENPVTITFIDGTFNCTAEREITVTCEWNADGGMAQGRNALPNAADLDSAADNTDNNRANFIKCTAS